METPSTTPLSLAERFNVWIQESIMIKLFSIGFLILVLLLPSAWIQELIVERQSRAGDAIKEVSSKWSGAQTLTGPVLIIPYKKQDIIDRGKDGIEIHERIEKAYFLPDELSITGEVEPQMLNRGIFDVAVYKSKLGLASTFSRPDFKKLSIASDKVLWNEAHLAFGLTDLRGISDKLSLTVDGKEMVTEPSANIGVSVTSSQGTTFSDDSYREDYNPTIVSSTGITTKLPWESEEDFTGQVNLNMNLKGSQRLDFVPVGKTTTVLLNGAWKDPSFDGEMIPAERTLTDDSFSALWKILHFNRPFPQQWTNENPVLKGSGVKLLIPVDQYQKSIRTSKYGVLIILLTFIALLLVEITQKIRIHPFQYILIGVALIIYYTLLLSISEHTGYNIAYVIASVATVVLISLYSSTFLRERRLVGVFAALLVIFYAFIFVIILQQDFSLLIGSVGLFVIVGLVMYFSRGINWYGSERAGQAKQVAG